VERKGIKFNAQPSNLAQAVYHYEMPSHTFSSARREEDAGAEWTDATHIYNRRDRKGRIRMTRQFVPFDDSYRVPADVRVSRGVRTGKRLFVCGQMDLDASGQACHPGDLETQTERAMTLLCDVIEKAGMKPAHTVQLHVFYKGEPDQASYRRQILDRFPQFSEALILLTPVASYPSKGADVEIDAIVVEDDWSAIVEDESGRVVGARRGEWAFVQGHSTSQILEVQVAEIAARVHRVLQGLRADIEDVCRVNAYFSGDLDTETVARAEQQLASVFAESAPSYHAAVLPRPLPAGQGLLVEVIALRAIDGSRLPRTSAEGSAAWSWPNELPYSQAVRCADTVFVSSQLPINGDGRVSHLGDIAGQTHLVMRHMASALESVGANFSHMTKVNAYFEGHENQEDWSVNVGIRSGYYVKPGPASTGIEVTRLSAEGALISADCVAIID
jgi:enamine deaminase RidA (YjgF/YER057c/UK114 family)